MSRIEQITAIAVGIGTVFLFDRLHLIPSSYMTGRIAAKAALLSGGAIVILVWPFIFRKKDDE